MEGAKQADLNLKIVELLDFSYSIIAKRIHVFPCEDSNHNYVFNPINDPVQREPLMLELLREHWTPCFSYTGERVIWWNENRIKFVSDAHFGKALCLAFVEMMESKGAS